MDEVTPPTPFARNIRRLRKEHGMSQERLAQELEVTFATVSRWERGKSEPTLPGLALIAAFFGVRASDLLDDELEVVPS